MFGEKQSRLEPASFAFVNPEKAAVITRKDLIAKSRERAMKKGAPSAVIDELEFMDKASRYSYTAKSNTSSKIIYNRALHKD